ncbi:hypothetical protein [Conexibacter arvalis]|uniref:Uncharacterized protein n=1 Tax=Conexibacter arvalis TaxID=912552 RepID=A0A840IH71_9ACTN|nr:hypothetical protein [Conexibacter arvalis]MBB4663300.1 hypothetical protein [Conexibacter arvalis]
MHRFVALIAVVAALAALPAAALAQDNPFLPDSGQQTPRQNTPPPPAPVEEDRGDDGDLGPGVAIGVGVIVVALIAGIWIAISRDARGAAPDRRRQHTARTEPDADLRATPGSRGRHATRARRGRKPSKQEQKRRKRGRAR